LKNAVLLIYDIVCIFLAGPQGESPGGPYLIILWKIRGLYYRVEFKRALLGWPQALARNAQAGKPGPPFDGILGEEGSEKDGRKRAGTAAGRYYDAEIFFKAAISAGSS
jgi:hypothetical protein